MASVWNRGAQAMLPPGLLQNMDPQMQQWMINRTKQAAIADMVGALGGHNIGATNRMQGMIPGLLEQQQAQEAARQEEARRAQMASLLGQEGLPDWQIQAFTHADPNKQASLAFGLHNINKDVLHQMFPDQGPVHRAPTNYQIEVASGARPREETASTTALRTRAGKIRDHLDNNPEMTYNEAADLVDGYARQVTDPITGRTSVISLRTREGAIVPTHPPTDPQPLPSWTQGSASLGADEATPVTGVSGFAKNLTNQVLGAVGAPELFPGEAQFFAITERLKNDSTLRMAEGYAGRPSNFVVQKYDQLSADPRKIMQGDQALYRDLREFRNLVERDRRMTEEIARDPFSVDAKTLQQTYMKLRTLNDVAADYDAVLELMDSVRRYRRRAPEQPPPQTAPDWVPEDDRDLWQFWSPEQRQEYEELMRQMRGGR